MTEKLETLHRLIEQLPELNHAVFERVIFHLARSVDNTRAVTNCVVGLLSKRRPTSCPPIILPSYLLPSLLSLHTNNLPRSSFLTFPNRQGKCCLLSWPPSLYHLYSCMECIISEQLDKLKATLHEIECLTSASHKTVSLIEDIMESNKVIISYSIP